MSPLKSHRRNKLLIFTTISVAKYSDVLTEIYAVSESNDITVVQPCTNLHCLGLTHNSYIIYIYKSYMYMTEILWGSISALEINVALMVLKDAYSESKAVIQAGAMVWWYKRTVVWRIRWDGRVMSDHTNHLHFSHRK